MKRRFDFSSILLIAGLTAGLMQVWPTQAAPPAKTPAPKTPAPEAVARSSFTMPANPKEGRDPFFPTSNRPYESVQASQPHVGDITSLVLKGVSGPPDRRLAIINNHTFAIGDSQDIVTPQGRIHVRCVEIRDDSVVIESGGMNRELKYNNNQ
ncbi:MAG TPA: hypothetical protein VMB80_04440 [Candidatus Acidoferrum sp.]|nr:hypothetical protein [Candidatus Acidoferrum sp.]